MNRENERPMNGSPNGHAAGTSGDPAAAVRLRRQKVVEQRLEFSRETKQRLDEYRQQLDVLHQEHRKLMDAASEFAGNLGLVYDPERNSLQHFVIYDPQPAKPMEVSPGIAEAIAAAQPYVWLSDERQDLEKAAPEEPGAAAPAAPEAVAAGLGDTDRPDGLSQNPSSGRTLEVDGRAVADALEQVEPSAHPAPVRQLPDPLQSPPRVSERVLPYWEYVSWPLVLGAGLFIGVGIGKLTGLEAQMGHYGAAIFGALGLMLLAGVKLLLGTVWYPHGRQVALRGKSAWTLTVALLMTMVFVGAEASLGTVALRQYILNTMISSSEMLPVSLLFFVALCISAPVLLCEGVLQYWRGHASIGEDERLRASQERLLEEKIRLAREREEAERKRIEEEERRRQEEHELQMQLLREREERERRRSEECLAQEAEQARAQVEEERRRLEEALRHLQEDREKLEGYRNRPDFQALMTTISQISACRFDIQRVQKEAAHYAKARGYEGYSLGH